MDATNLVANGQSRANLINKNNAPDEIVYQYMVSQKIRQEKLMMQ